MISQEGTPSVLGRSVQFVGLLRQSARRTGGTARKFTPYRTTPATRKIYRCVNPSPQDPENSESPSVERCEADWSVFTQKTWQTYKVTPFYQFSYKPKDLKYFGTSLGAYMEAETCKGMAVEMEEAVDSAAFSVLKGIKQGGDADCLEITLKAKPKRGNGQSKVVVLTAVLCSVHLNPEVVPYGNSGDFTALPLMLVKGSVSLTGLLCDWLQNQFDCSISPLHLSSVLLSWMVAMWAGDVTKKQTKPVELQYTVPSQIEGLSRVTMTIDARDCKVLWENIHDAEDQNFKEEEAIVFMKSLAAHFYHFFKIHLSHFQLTRIGTSIALVGVGGKLKIFSKKHVISILAHLTEICSEEILEL